MKKRRNILACLCTVFLLAGTAAPSFTSQADSKADKIQDSIKQKQSAIGEAQKQKQALESGLTGTGEHETEPERLCGEAG